LSNIDIKSLSFLEMKAELADLYLPDYKIRQLYGWLHKNGAESYNEMNNLSVRLREMLHEKYYIQNCRMIKKQISKRDDTVKYLLSLADDELIETVLMKYKYGYSLCISTQVGCKMGCRFCATGLRGFVRNLAASEMLSQIHTAQRDMNIRVSHVVLMGMGEPLDNYDNVLKFIDLVSNQDGLNIGTRNLSLSTCGIVPAIYKLAEKKLQLTLSVSLHAPNDQIRNMLMPINIKYPVKELLEACKDYTTITSRRISFEYAMFKGVNDSKECALQLSEKLKEIKCHVNLIPGNNVNECPYQKSTSVTIERFAEVLMNKRINATVRRTLGSDIEASCGQLRRRNDEEQQINN